MFYYLFSFFKGELVDDVLVRGIFLLGFIVFYYVDFCILWWFVKIFNNGSYVFILGNFNYLFILLFNIMFI